MPDFNYAGALGYPGEYRYPRIQPEMYRSRLWTMRQYAGYGLRRNPTNATGIFWNKGWPAKYSLSTTHSIGYDSDNPLCKGEVGKVGVAVDTLEDMEILFQVFRWIK